METSPLSRSCSVLRYVFAILLLRCPRLSAALTRSPLARGSPLARDQPLPQPLVAAPERLALAQRPMAVVASFFLMYRMYRTPDTKKPGIRQATSSPVRCLLLAYVFPASISILFVTRARKPLALSSLLPTVEMRGLEPTTSPLSEERSNRLSYRPALFYFFTCNPHLNG